MKIKDIPDFFYITVKDCDISYHRIVTVKHKLFPVEHRKTIPYRYLPNKQLIEDTKKKLMKEILLDPMLLNYYEEKIKATDQELLKEIKTKLEDL